MALDLSKLDPRGFLRPNPTDPERLANLIWTVLERECGAPAGDRDNFVLWWARDDWPMTGFEWRFQGDLGFGGKLMSDRPGHLRVTCYREDETPERLAMIQRANERLGELVGVMG